MSMSFLYLLFLSKMMSIFRKHKVVNVIFYDHEMFAVYYDEKKDRIRYLLLSCTVVYEVDGSLVYNPVLEDQEKVNRNWIFLEVSGEVKPMSHYTEVILDKLVKKVRLAMGTS